jgi:hypothetical protein
LLGLNIFAAMKKLFFTGACLVALASSPVLAQTGGAELVVVRVLEDPRSIYVSITTPDGQTEDRKLDSGFGTKGLTASSKAFHQLLNEFYQKGYRLQSTFSTVNSTSDSRTTLVLVKGQ